MTNSFKEFISFLRGSREGSLPSTQTFPPIDIERLANDLRIDQRAKDNGKSNLPRTKDEAEDVVEQDIVAEINRFARKAADEYRAQMELYEGRIRRAAIRVDQNAMIEAAGKNALSDFTVQATDDLNHLSNAQHEVEGRKREYDKFRETHKLTRLPNIVTSKQRTLRWLVIAVLVVLEAMFNGLFFAEGSETGIVGGVIQAIMLSTLNIGVAVLYARFGFPYVWHVHDLKRILGILSSIAYAAWAIGLNLFIGGFRDLYVANVGQVDVSDILERFMNGSLLPSQANSLFLVFFGIGLSIVALIEAISLKDFYPGYGAVGQRLEEAKNTYADLKSRCLDGLRARRDYAIDEMTRVIELMREGDYETRLAFEGRARLHENYRAFLFHLGDTYSRLIQRYREQNMSTRSTTPPPRFGKRPPVLPFLEEPKLTTIELNIEGRQKAVSRMEYFIGAVNQQFENEDRRYRTISVLIDDKTI